MRNLAPLVTVILDIFIQIKLSTCATGLRVNNGQIDILHTVKKDSSQIFGEYLAAIFKGICLKGQYANEEDPRNHLNSHENDYDMLDEKQHPVKQTQCVG